MSISPLRRCLLSARRWIGRNVVSVRGIAVPLPTPEDLVIMKAVAHRPRDMSDLEAVIEANPKLDRKRIQAYVREFASLLDRPDMVEVFERILSQHRPRARPSAGISNGPPICPARHAALVDRACDGYTGAMLAAFFSVFPPVPLSMRLRFGSWSIGGWTFNGLGGNNTLTVVATLKTDPVTFTGGTGGSNTADRP